MTQRHSLSLLCIVFTLFVTSCGTVPASITPDPHGLVEFDFGPKDWDSLLDLGKNKERLVWMITLQLLTKKAIPGAKDIGLITVEKRLSGTVTGWHCGNTEPLLKRLSNFGRLRRDGERADRASLLSNFGRLRRDAERADRASATSHLAQTQRIRDSLPKLSAVAWRVRLTDYMIARLKLYETHGKRHGKDKGLGKGMAWRSWMRTTLAEINKKAKQSGLSDGQRMSALNTWLMCHISPLELERIRDKLEQGEL